MRNLLIFVVLTVNVGELLTLSVECKEEGCYEVVKVFVEQLERRINETDAILQQATNELSKIVYGNDEVFKQKIKEVDGKLSKLINELNVGIEGGDKTLFQLIESVFEDKDQIESLTEGVETSADSSSKASEATHENFANVQDIIRQIQAEINRLLNATEVDGPLALQDAFDRSEKLKSSTSQLKEIHDEVKLILKDFEENLQDAKRLTSLAVAKFAEVSKQVNQTIAEQEATGEKLSETSDMETSGEELKNIKKLAKEALDEANKVFDQAFDLLDEVSKLELNSKLKKIVDKVEEMKNHSSATETNLEKLSNEYSKFLDEMEKSIDAATALESRAFKLQTEVDQKIKDISEVRDGVSKAIADVDDTIAYGQKVLSSLIDFTFSVEKSRESARMALEKIPEIMKRIGESVKIVENLEGKLANNTKIANDAKAKCLNAKKQMEEILDDSDSITARIDKLEADIENVTSDISVGNRESTQNTRDTDALERTETEDNELIKSTKEAVEKSKIRIQKADEKVDDALKKVEKLINDITEAKSIDQENLNDFEIRLKEAEDDLEKSKLHEKLKKLKEERQAQEETMKQYEVDIGFLEYQISVFKKNYEALEKKCFKRVKLEP